MPDKTHPHAKTGLRSRLFLLCLLLSLLLHLFALWQFAKQVPRKEPVRKPTYVTLEERPEKPTQPPREMELDQPPQPPSPPPENASRIAETARSVPQEMAPRGDDTRDRTASSKPPQLAARPQTIPSQPTSPPSKEQGRKAPQVSEQSPTITRPVDETPPLQQLTKLAPETMERLSRSERQRIKRRDDVLEGDEIYLNLQHDYLISFFKRFSNKIEAVWNYPVTSAQRGEEGVLLLKITINREGELLDVDLLETSQWDDLDFEAIQAVYRAAPFGPVSSHWPHEQMKIYAHFQYTLSNRIIYGR